MNDCHVLPGTAQSLLCCTFESCMMQVTWKEWVLLHANSHMPQLLLKWALLQLTSCTPILQA